MHVRWQCNLKTVAITHPMKKTKILFSCEPVAAYTTSYCHSTLNTNTYLDFAFYNQPLVQSPFLALLYITSRPSSSSTIQNGPSDHLSVCEFDPHVGFAFAASCIITRNGISPLSSAGVVAYNEVPIPIKFRLIYAFGDTKYSSGLKMLWLYKKLLSIFCTQNSTQTPSCPRT